MTWGLREEMRSEKKAADAEKKPASNPAREREQPVMADDDGDDDFYRDDRD